MNTMKEVNDQQKEMALKKKILYNKMTNFENEDCSIPALLLCLYLAA